MPSSEAKPILFDTDVITNWLIKETETATEKPLWEAPVEIISRVESGKCKGFISLMTLLELRFLLRHKKKVAETQIHTDIQNLMELFEIVVPDEGELLRANKLQSQYLLDPFDSILLSLALSIPHVTLLSRDTKFLRIAEKLIETASPEEFLKHFK